MPQLRISHFEPRIKQPKHKKIKYMSDDDDDHNHSPNAFLFSPPTLKSQPKQKTSRMKSLASGLSSAYKSQNSPDKEVLAFKIKMEEDALLATTIHTFSSIPTCLACKVQVIIKPSNKKLSRAYTQAKLSDDYSLFCEYHVAHALAMQEGKREGYPILLDSTKIRNRCVLHRQKLTDIISKKRPSYYLDVALKRYADLGTIAAQCMNINNTSRITCPFDIN